jgi:hypothetical protein
MTGNARSQVAWLLSDRLTRAESDRLKSATVLAKRESKMTLGSRLRARSRRSAMFLARIEYLPLGVEAICRFLFGSVMETILSPVSRRPEISRS